MKYNYALLWLLSLFTFSFINAQNCPETLGNNSTTTLIHFNIAEGSCNSYPSTITVEASTFSYKSCNGTNLKYELTSGAPLSIFDTFSADFGSGMVCDYLEGVLRQETLSIGQVSNVLESIKVFPNPITNGNEINVAFSKNISGHIYIYDITGKIVLSEEIAQATTKQINISSLNNGIYMLQIVAENASNTRKIVVMK